jgi:flagellar basal-body rod protein FlgC
VAGSALNAQTIRLNTTASNLANAESVNGDASKVYRARHPVFQAMMDDTGPSSTAQAPRRRARARRGGEHGAAHHAL